VVAGENSQIFSSFPAFQSTHRFGTELDDSRATNRALRLFDETKPVARRKKQPAYL